MARPPHGSGQKAIRSAISELAKEKPTKERSLLEHIRGDLEKIERQLERGHTMARVADALTDGGLPISHNTLRQYVQRLRRERDAVEKTANPVAKQARTSMASPLASGPAVALSTSAINAEPRVEMPRRPAYVPPLPGDDEI